jgi:hypothetical protein
MIGGVLTQEETATAPPAGYVANAVHIIGSAGNYLSIAALSCGTDNGFYSFSFWANNLMSSNNSTDLFVDDAAGIYSPFHENTSTGQFEMQFNTAGSALVFNRGWKSHFPAAIYTPGIWFHYLFSAETNLASGSQIASLYVNDVLITPDFTGPSAGFILPLNGKSFDFGDDTFASGPTIDCADVWFGPNIKLHDVTGAIPTATRRQFIDASGKPVNPASWPTSAVKFYGNASQFPTNHGTGGVFTLHGSFTNAATHP